MKSFLVAGAALAIGLSGFPALAHKTDCGAQRPVIERVFADYRAAIGRLDARGTERLFAANSAGSKMAASIANSSGWYTLNRQPDLRPI